MIILAKKRILFFTPFSKRNGAEMMLWYLMKYANKQDFEFAVYSLHAGELLSELPDNIPYFTPPKSTNDNSLKRRIINRLSLNPTRELTLEEHIQVAHNEFRPDIWYINTILCSQVTRLAIKLQVPYAIHLHELLFLYQHILYDDMKDAILNAQFLVGCSKGVCEKIKIMGGKKVVLQYECVDIKKISEYSSLSKQVVTRADVGIKDDKFVWVMSGSIEYRKGTDLLPAIARAVSEKAVIIWLGPGSSGYSYFIEQELVHFNIDNVIFLGPKSSDYYDYLSLADGMLLTSREDPFPLVMIEAAAMAKPIVSFNSGGVKEFLKEGMGVVIESSDVNDLIQAMYQVMDKDVLIDKELSVSRASEFDAKAQVELWQTSIMPLV
jgi:glycosyltransferase involved in cell wall biosynthesis